MGSLVEAHTGHAQACFHAVEHGHKHPKLGRTSHAPQKLKTAYSKDIRVHPGATHFVYMFSCSRGRGSHGIDWLC